MARILPTIVVTSACAAADGRGLAGEEASYPRPLGPALARRAAATKSRGTCAAGATHTRSARTVPAWRPSHCVPRNTKKPGSLATPASEIIPLPGGEAAGLPISRPEPINFFQNMRSPVALRPLPDRMEG